MGKLKWTKYYIQIYIQLCEKPTWARLDGQKQPNIGDCLRCCHDLWHFCLKLSSLLIIIIWTREIGSLPSDYLIALCCIILCDVTHELNSRIHKNIEPHNCTIYQNRHFQKLSYGIKYLHVGHNALVSLDRAAIGECLHWKMKNENCISNTI